jgi:hypothetical protein
MNKITFLIAIIIIFVFAYFVLYHWIPSLGGPVIK